MTRDEAAIAALKDASDEISRRGRSCAGEKLMGERDLFPAEAAERYYKASAGKSYRPSNGTEGEYFQDLWCAHCKRDRAYRRDSEQSDGCTIIGDSMCFEIDEPGYPKKWVYSDDGQPKCTAFEAANND